MTYNADITHCSGYCCLKRDECLRFKLFVEWCKMKKRPDAVMMASCYDFDKEECTMFRPIENESK